MFIAGRLHRDTFARLLLSAGTGNNASIFFERARPWQLSKDHLQIRIGFDSIRHGRFNEAVKTGTGLGPGDAVAEKEVLCADDKRPEYVLGEIVVHAQTPIFRVRCKLRPLLVSIVHGFAKCRPWRHDRDVLIQPDPELVK